MKQHGGPVRRVAFGDFPSWTKMIRPNIGVAYTADFVDLGTTPLDDYDAVIPVQLTDYKKLRRHPEWSGKKFIHPEPETVALCDDKLHLAEFLIGQGFESSIPPLRGPGSPYPYIRKKRRGWWGMQCQIIESPNDEQDLGNDEWFCQTLIPGSIEFATHILRSNGRIHYASTFSYKMAKPVFIKGAKDTPLQTRFHPGCRYLDLFSKILEKIDFQGTVCIDYKIFNLQPMIFEINPRFGGSLSLDITAYLNAYCEALE